MCIFLVESRNGTRGQDKVSAIITMLPSKQYQHSQLGMAKSRTTLAKRRQTNRVHPEQPLDTELGDLGIKKKYIENEEEQWKALITIKSLPVSMTQKRNIK